MHPHEITLRAPASPRTADYLRFSQTAAASHLKALGLEGKLEQQGYVWVIVRIHGRIYKPLPPTFTVRTWPGAAKGGFLPRYCRLLDGDTVLADMVTLWVLADASSRAMAQVDAGVPEMSTGYELPIPRALPRKQPEGGIPFTVQNNWIDENGHMNNCFYPQAAEDALGISRLPKAFWVDFRRELLPGQTAQICCREESDGLLLSGWGESEHFRMKLQY